jgi:hypothetical protein
LDETYEGSIAVKFISKILTYNGDATDKYFFVMAVILFEIFAIFDNNLEF